jgi:hypothetical protein
MIKRGLISLVVLTSLLLSCSFVSAQWFLAWLATQASAHTRDCIQKILMIQLAAERILNKRYQE